jgi:hypothetical protein
MTSNASQFAIDRDGLVIGAIHLFHAKRHIALHVRHGVETMEFLWRYANDGHRMAVVGDCFTDNARITREASFPVVVTQDNDGAESRGRSF